MLDISGEQSDERAARRFIGLERTEQLRDAGIHLRRLGWLLELGGEQLDVAAADRRHAIVRARVRMARQLQQLAHDLRIGLAIEAVPVDRPRRPHFIEQGAVNRPSSRPCGPEEGSVDVE